MESRLNLFFSTTELQDRLSSQAERCLNPGENYKRKFPAAAPRSAGALTLTSCVSPSEAKTGLQDLIAQLKASGNARAAQSESGPIPA